VERGERDNCRKGIKERMKGVRNDNTKENVPTETQNIFYTSMIEKKQWHLTYC
jgi:hypothetical protein